MIKTKKDLHFYIQADRIMNGWPAKKNWIKESKLISGNRGIIIKYLEHLRKYAYYYNTHKKAVSFNSIMLVYEHYRLADLSIKTGFTIGTNSLGYGVVIPHHGTIVVNGDAVVGNFAVLHTCTCIAGGNKQIGDGLYLSSGSQIVGDVVLGDNVTIAAHSLVNHSNIGHTLLAGSPAIAKKNDYSAWYIRDGAEFISRVNKVLSLTMDLSQYSEFK